MSTKEPARTRLVQTNLTGVFGKVRSPDVAARPPGIASLLDPALLARLSRVNESTLAMKADLLR